VVTADRGLRARLPEDTIAMSPSTVLGWLPNRKRNESTLS
jgi:8-oxo-dGTP diphosphatase